LEKLHQETSSDICAGEWLGKRQGAQEFMQISTLRELFNEAPKKQRKKSLGID